MRHLDAHQSIEVPWRVARIEPPHRLREPTAREARLSLTGGVAISALAEYRRLLLEGAGEEALMAAYAVAIEAVGSFLGIEEVLRPIADALDDPAYRTLEQR